MKDRSTRSLFHSLALIASAGLVSLMLAASATAGTGIGDIDGCQDPSDAGLAAFGEFDDVDPGPTCEKVCVDGRKACLGAAKGNLACVKSVVGAAKKAIKRICQDPDLTEDEDDCFASNAPQIASLEQEIKEEKGEIKNDCEQSVVFCTLGCTPVF